MADFSDFPFEMFTIDEIAKMLILSVDLRDKDFAAACSEQLKHRRVRKGERKEQGEPDGTKR